MKKIHHPLQNTIMCFVAFFAGALPISSEAAEPAHYEKTLAVLRDRMEAIRAGRLFTPDQIRTLEVGSESDPEIIPDDVITLLRSKGFGITGGYGHLTRSGANLGMLQVRFNAMQQSATTRANRENRREFAKLAPIGSRKKLSHFANFKNAEQSVDPDQLFTDNSDLPAWSTWLSGVYVWGGYTTKEVEFGTEKARPLFGGLSLGFGPIEQGASTVHLDVGIALYPNRKMPKDDIYVGLSIDWALFKKLVKSI
jgi:hypothetical protein